MGPFCKLIKSTAIDFANVKRHSPQRTCTSCLKKLSRALIIIDCGFTLSVQERQGPEDNTMHTLQIAGNVSRYAEIQL